MPGPHTPGTRKTITDRESGKSARHERNKTARRLFNQELARVFKGVNYLNVGFLSTTDHGGLVKIDKDWTKSSRRQSKRRH